MKLIAKQFKTYGIHWNAVGKGIMFIAIQFHTNTIAHGNIKWQGKVCYSHFNS